MTTEPIFARFKSTNIWPFAVDRRMSSTEFRRIGKARHVREVTSWRGAVADWICGTRKERARRLAYDLQHASDPQVRLTSAVALQQLVAAPYQRNFRFESLDAATVKLRISAPGIAQEVTVTPARALTAVRDAILGGKQSGAACADALPRSAAERISGHTCAARVEPIDLSACLRYRELTRHRTQAPLVALLDTLADPATFWAIRTVLEQQREVAVKERGVSRRQWLTAAGYLRPRAAPAALHFRPTLALTEPTPGVFQLAWHAEPQAPEHKCAHRAFDAVLLVTRAHIHCIYAR